MFAVFASNLTTDLVLNGIQQAQCSKLVSKYVNKVKHANYLKQYW